MFSFSTGYGPFPHWWPTPLILVFLVSGVYARILHTLLPSSVDFNLQMPLQFVHLTAFSLLIAYSRPSSPPSLTLTDGHAAYPTGPQAPKLRLICTFYAACMCVVFLKGSVMSFPALYHGQYLSLQSLSPVLAQLLAPTRGPTSVRHKHGDKTSWNAHSRAAGFIVLTLTLWPHKGPVIKTSIFPFYKWYTRCCKHFSCTLVYQDFITICGNQAPKSSPPYFGERYKEVKKHPYQTFFHRFPAMVNEHMKESLNNPFNKAQVGLMLATHSTKRPNKKGASQTVSEE